MRFIILQTLNALSYGSLLFMIASGFSLIFGLMKMTNMVHMAFFSTGLYLGYFFINYFDNYLVAIILTGLLVCLQGYMVFKFFLFRLRGNSQSQVLLCLGFLFLFDDLLLWIFGGTPLLTRTPYIFSGSIPLFNLEFPVYRIFLILLGIILIIFMELVLTKTKIGALVRSGVDDAETTSAMGVNINAVFAVVYIVGTFLAGVGGVLGGALVGMEPRISFTYLPIMLAIVVVGGLGNIRGSYIASMLIAAIDTFGKALFPEFAYFTIFLPMAVILVFKPEGLFSRGMRKRRTHK